MAILNITFALRPSSATTVSNDKNAKNEPPPSTEALVLLADQLLLQLPLEALGCLQGENYVSLSRDISLQFLHHKVSTEPIGEFIGFTLWVKLHQKDDLIIGFQVRIR